MAYSSGITDPAGLSNDGYGGSYGETYGLNQYPPASTASTTPSSSDSGHVQKEDLLSIETQKLIMDSIMDLFRLDDGTSSTEFDDDDDDGAPINYEDQVRRTGRLKGLAPALVQLWRNKSEYTAGATEKLADGSRDPKWRIPIGQSGLLHIFLQIIATEGVEHTLMTHALRLIGNSCADTDDNREIIVSQNGLRPIIILLNVKPLLPLVIPVLFNICIDYEPAQKQASEGFLTKGLLDQVRRPDFSENRALLSYVCKLLDMLITHSSEVDNAPDPTAAILLSLAADPEFLPDLEDFLALVQSAVLYLQHVKFQQGLIKYPCGIFETGKALSLSYTRFEDTSTTYTGTSDSNQDDATRLTSMRNSLNQALSDISALPEFTAAFPVTSPISSRLRKWLSGPHSQLQVCACIMLGNIARSDAACEEFVHTLQIHKPLIAILNDTNDIQVLHATLGFLKNLALPLRNKLELGNAGLIYALERLWSLEVQPQIQYSSLSLLRQLLIGTFENVIQVAQHLSTDPDSPAYLKSRLSILIDIFHKTDVEPIKMEVARLFAAIVRVFTSPNAKITDEDRLRKVFFERHPDIGRPISYMVTQKKWPVVRSEGWFVMALMCRTPEGAKCVSNIMHDLAVFQPLVELLTGKSLVDGQPINCSGEDAGQSLDGTSSASDNVPKVADAKAAEMARIDRENALVLLSELMRYCGASMAPMRRSTFEDLLKGGGATHMSYAQIKDREAFYDGKKAPPQRNVVDMMQDTADELLG